MRCRQPGQRRSRDVLEATRPPSDRHREGSRRPCPSRRRCLRSRRPGRRVCWGQHSRVPGRAQECGQAMPDPTGKMTGDPAMIDNGRTPRCLADGPDRPGHRRPDRRSARGRLMNPSAPSWLSPGPTAGGRSDPPPPGHPASRRPGARPCPADRVVQGLLQQLAGRQLRQVLRDADAALVQLEQLDVLLGLVGAEDQPQGRLLAGPASYFSSQRRYSSICPLSAAWNRADLQVDRHEPAQPAVVEEQIEVIILVVHRDPLLPGDEGEIAPHLQDERLQLAEDRLLHVLLGIRCRSGRGSRGNRDRGRPGRASSGPRPAARRCRARSPRPVSC